MKRNLIALTYFIVACTSAPTTETSTSVDTLVTKAVATDTMPSPVPVVVVSEPEVIVSDSVANSYKTSVEFQLEEIKNALADSANYYVVTMTDYYDEWEGQAEMTNVAWYFNKELSIVYYYHSYETGSMDKPDTEELVFKNDSISCVKETLRFYGEISGRSLIFWDIKIGGVQVNMRVDDQQLISKTATAKDFHETKLNSMEVDLNTMKGTFQNGIRSVNGDAYTFLITKEKNAGLTDYTRVVIPKVVYDKLNVEE